MSQQVLGDLVGVTFQQIQKYERGSNRIGASRLWAFSQHMDVPVGYFYEGFGTPQDHDFPANDDEEITSLIASPIGTKFALILPRITDKGKLNSLLDMARQLAD